MEAARFEFNLLHVDVSTSSGNLTSETPEGSPVLYDFTWEQHYDGLLHFYQGHKPFNVSEGYLHKGTRLDLWVSEQQVLLRQIHTEGEGNASQQELCRSRRLRDIGFPC
jgi:hypothetical protein